MQRVYKNKMAEEKQPKRMNFIESPEPGQSVDDIITVPQGAILWSNLGYNDPKKQLSPEEIANLKAKVKGILTDMPETLTKLKSLDDLTEEGMREWAGNPYGCSEEEIYETCKTFCESYSKFLYNYWGIPRSEQAGIPLPPTIKSDIDLEKRLSKQSKLDKSIGNYSMIVLSMTGLWALSCITGEATEMAGISNWVKYPIIAVGGIAGAVGGICGGCVINDILERSVDKERKAYETRQREEFMLEVKKYAEEL